MSSYTSDREFEGIGIVCVDCQEEFLFSAGEQRFFSNKGLTNPKRCPTCRKWRKSTIYKEDK